MPPSSFPALAVAEWFVATLLFTVESFRLRDVPFEKCQTPLKFESHGFVVLAGGLAFPNAR
jgi:hypothetical protein